MSAVKNMMMDLQNELKEVEETVRERMDDIDEFMSEDTKKLLERRKELRSQLYV